MTDDEAAERAIGAFTARNDADGCGFLLVTREDFGRPRHLFGSRSPALTAHRITVFAGRATEGGDVVRGDGVASMLMTDEAFAEMAFGAGSAWGSAATLDLAAGQPLPAYDVPWRSSMEAAASERIGSREQSRIVREAAAEVDEIVKARGFVPARAGDDLANSVRWASENLFGNADYQLSRYAESVSLAAASEQLAMAAAIAHSDGITEAIRSGFGLIGPPRHRAEEAMRVAALAFEGGGDPRGICVQVNHVSGGSVRHSAFPHGRMNLRLTFGRARVAAHKEPEDGVNPERESLVLDISPKELILAIEGHDPVRCDLTRVFGRTVIDRFPWRSPWGDPVAAEAPDGLFPPGDPGREPVLREAREISALLRAGSAAKRSHASLADRMRGLADAMDKTSDLLVTLSEKPRAAIRSRVAAEAAERVATSALGKAWARISSELRGRDAEISGPAREDDRGEPSP